MPRFTLANPLVRLSLVLTLGACTQESSTPLPSHPALVQGTTPEPFTQGGPEALQLEREAQGAYLEGSVERFHLVLPDSGASSITWSASGGQLVSQQERATWTLPRSGPATLTVKVVTQSGQELSETYSFLVAQAMSGTPSEVSSLVSLAAPVQVDPSSDAMGYQCDLAFDPTGKGHLIYTNDTHDSLWYATWTGTTWTTEQVDGPGFNTGGAVYSPISLVLDAANNPHIAYMLSGRGIWYATRSGATWTRERVDKAATPPEQNGSASIVSIALDPSQGNRPTIAYAFYSSSTGYHNVVVAYRTGAGAWSSALERFPSAVVNESQYLSGDVLFNSSGTLFVPFMGESYAAYLGAWKATSATQSFALPTNYFLNTNFYPNVSLSWAGTNRLLMRTVQGLLDVTVNTTVANSTFTYSQIDSAVSAYYGELVFTGGKPYVAHSHGGQLELITPDARGFWTYSQLGSVGTFGRMGMAVRPTTGLIHMCYTLNTHVMFQ